MTATLLGAVSQSHWLAQVTDGEMILTTGNYNPRLYGLPWHELLSHFNLRVVDVYSLIPMRLFKVIQWFYGTYKHLLHKYLAEHDTMIVDLDNSG